MVFHLLKMYIPQYKYINFIYSSHSSVLFLQVNDLSLTGTFLDKALFSEIAAKRKEGYNRKLVNWIRDCITAWDYDNNVASVCLDSLVNQGILGKERKMAGLKTDYPTKNPGEVYFLQVPARLVLPYSE